MFSASFLLLVREPDQRSPALSQRHSVPQFRRSFPALFEPDEGGLDGALADLECVFGELLDAVGESPATHGREGKRLGDEQVERALQDLFVRLGQRSLLPNVKRNTPSSCSGPEVSVVVLDVPTFCRIRGSNECLRRVGGFAGMGVTRSPLVPYESIWSMYPGASECRF